MYNKAKHLTHIKNNMVKADEVTASTLFHFITSRQLTFDTESCTDQEGDMTGARVYAWSLGCVNSDIQIYGTNLDSFFVTLKSIAEESFNKGLYEEGKYKKDVIEVIPVAVHNLQWDLEFIKYYLNNNDYKYDMGNIKSIFKPAYHESLELSNELYTYNITQADNVVYNCRVVIAEYEKTTKRGKKYYVKYVVDFWDSLKILTTSIDKIDSFCSLDQTMFCKLADEYDYDLWRSPEHILTDDELRYLYNDVYRLKEAIKQFYLPKLIEYELKDSIRTASGLAFSVLKQISFEDNDAYNKYYGIGASTNVSQIITDRMESDSYSGGYTHANHTIIDKTITCDGSSFDINSSYPSQMAYESLPFGKPIQCLDYLPDFVDNEEFVALIEIGFDYVKPKKKEYNLPVFKIGADNKKALSCIYGNGISGNEYFATNVLQGNFIEVTRVGNNNLESNYTMTITSVEYDFFIKHYDFGTYEDYGTYGGLEIGNVLIYKAERRKHYNFVNKFIKMKQLYKGSTAEEIRELYNNDNEYFDGLLSEDELKEAMISGVKADKSLVQFAKLCLNSSYGKFGSKTKRGADNLIVDNEGLIRFNTKTDDNYVHFDYLGKEYYRPVASFITAYGRLKLWKSIIALGVDNFLYCDTDSIYCSLNKDEATRRLNKVGQYVDSKKLGYWDNEHNFKTFKVLGQKKYMLEENTGEIDCRCAGCPKSVQKQLCNEGFSEFYLGKQIEGKKQRLKVVGGCLLHDVKFSITKYSY